MEAGKKFAKQMKTSLEGGRAQDFFDTTLWGQFFSKWIIFG